MFLDAIIGFGKCVPCNRLGVIRSRVLSSHGSPLRSVSYDKTVKLWDVHLELIDEERSGMCEGKL